MDEFGNKVALITGGNSGIGRATALAFAQQGAKVVIASRRIQESEETVSLIQDKGGTATFIQTDITQAVQVKNLIAQIVNNYGRIDYTFNNAGVEEPVTSSVEKTEEIWNSVIDTNLKGVWLSMKYQITQMLKQGGGVIINNSSILGLVGFPHVPIYAASKHGVIGLTKSLALEHAKDNIRINCLCPGGIETDLLARNLDSLGEEGKSKFISLHPMGRLGKPEEIANSVIWLCSQSASFVTGQSFVIDGGFTAQ
ncbi:SDR family oxidoreductase [Calothrix sp. NIES-2098]|uniref:SDR family oxidoreductase n=1 Tax=Calothrix sp. NIES-2098 TaxID=1954171 RepID=UPI000B612CC5|nr:short chain dehydrogenase [Calothrix sp. NIES-2098]